MHVLPRRSASSTSAVCVRPRRSLCRGAALSCSLCRVQALSASGSALCVRAPESQPGALSLSVSGPGALWPRSLCRGELSFCVGCLALFLSGPSVLCVGPSSRCRTLALFGDWRSPSALCTLCVGSLCRAPALCLCRAPSISRRARRFLSRAPALRAPAPLDPRCVGAVEP